jgi:hypothetical protein
MGQKYLKPFILPAKNCLNRDFQDKYNFQEILGAERKKKIERCAEIFFP